MKKVIKLICLCAVAALCFSSCEKLGGGGSGKVNYSFGASATELHGMTSLAEWGQISDIYYAEFKKIQGATNFNSTGNSFDMEGKYKSTDALVISACKAAESVCASKGLSISDGYVTLRMQATYYSNTDTKEIYTKTYGNK